MSDSPEVFKTAFPELRSYTDAEKDKRRIAAGFTLVSFDRNIVSSLPRWNVNLTVEQIDLAVRYGEVWPEVPEPVLYTMHDARYVADHSYWSCRDIMFSVVGIYLEDPQSEKLLPKTKAFLESDPSGVAVIQSVLSRDEDKATQALAKLDDSEEVGLRLNAVETLAQASFLLDPPEIIQKLMASVKEANIPEEAKKQVWEFISAGIIDSKLRFKVARLRHGIFEETGMVQTEDGKAVPIEILRVQGVRLFYRRYVGAVEFFLNR